ncbi:polyketide cyclase/dehydrase [Leptospira ryugenii]|uniref:Polyketide cyclase/dehydrase n=1 Tax=Leptospira ryugenii TaxID=1917863 RepID=A0A2P2E3R4_9LEPT|nr:START domain-containing protein [Leptospira ryugenii]GBF51466.1 polyketide cyclase/dehydrase [Leptospira ryugenii]
MKEKISALVLTVFLLAIDSTTGIRAEEPTWKEAKRKNSVTVLTREYPGSSVDEFLGKTEVDATISQIFALLTELESCKSLYFNCKELVVLSGNERKNIVYVRNGAPWPVSDRDIIMERTLDQNAKTKVASMKLKKTESVSKPSPSGVTRMDSFDAIWRIIPTAAGKVRVEYQAHFEPGGSIPQSVINLAITDTPYNTLLSLRKAVEEGKHKDTKLDWVKEFE